jgi:hypothetical protein
MALDQTAAKDEIHQLKARYFRWMDEKDWENWGTLFTTDVAVLVDSEVSDRDRLTKPFSLPRGRDLFVANNAEILRDVVTVHHGHMPEITLTSDTTATGVWAMEDKLKWPDGRTMHGYGHYRETYRVEEGCWRIALLNLTRLRLEYSGPWPTDSAHAAILHESASGRVRFDR